MNITYLITTSYEQGLIEEPQVLKLPFKITRDDSKNKIIENSYIRWESFTY